jgi:3,4-dihydroxy 2-butanone 4-phosphate synthase/GTP cyclohydrolase II
MNNPDKVHKLTNVGIPIESVVPLEVPAVEENRKYMLTKKNKMKHILRGV